MTYSYALLLSVALFLGCTPSVESDAPACDESLGVLSIEYDANLDEVPGRMWFTDRKPLYTLGGQGAELYRVAVALFVSDGGIVVANNGSLELLLFDDAGQLLARAGGEGSGPGEFRQLSSLSVGPADSLFVYDQRQHRLSVFDRNGVYARAVILQGFDTLGIDREVGVLHSGEIVGVHHRRTQGVGLVLDSMLAVTFAASGEPAVPLGVFPYMYTHWGPHSMPDGGPGRAAFPLPVALSSVTAVGLGDTSIYLGLPDQYALIRLDLNGNRRVTCWRGLPQAVTEVHRERLFGWLSSNTRMRQGELDGLRNLEGPTTLPAFGFEPLTERVGRQALLVTDVGGVWLQPFQLPDDSSAAAWPRFDAAGAYEGTVTMPARFRATAVRGDVVLGVYQDATDVEYVRAYRLVSGR